MDFIEKLKKAIEKNNSLVCVGLDTDIDKLPKHLLSSKEPMFEFNKAIINATHDFVCSYKPNSAFYEAQGTVGILQLQKTIEYINTTYANIPVILDAKRADIGNTSDGYVKFAFDYLKADAVTVNPYLGFDAIEPFLQRPGKGVIILCRTSNIGAGDFQDLLVDGEPLYIKIAKKIVEWNKQYTNCLMVVGATGTNQLKTIRDMAPDMFFLVPGIGSQGGDVEKTLKAGLTSAKSGLIMSSSRAIIYASASEDFAQIAAEKTKELQEQINKYR